ncbi:hypothetical protein SAMN05216228_102449 [Rhizobium tibeticum]|uniref:Uncharacterized protein n=1 Tax=Rhizobium tibeticum TaxID=501024 RepID=A0A1H8SD48_9HYPH|nr:hypothetical protein RTCCBAU85039_4786 [Rhizobium tibeticum]SEO76495.1 hypothetical protein SAMN05216228_102449 [Rhizobium tibeticum]
MLAVNLSDTDAEQDAKDVSNGPKPRGLIAKDSTVTLGMSAKFAATRATDVVP